MRLLFTSDWHRDATTAGLAREGELSLYVDHVEEVVRREQVDVVLGLGDFNDPGQLAEVRYQRGLIHDVARLTRAAAVGSVWIPGNHDVQEVVPALSTLSPLAEVVRSVGIGAEHAERLVPWGVVSRRGVFEQVRVAELPTLIELKGHGEGVAVLCLPYVSRAVERTEEYRKAQQRAFQLARHNPCPTLVVISHLSLPGMHPGSEEEMPRGREVPFPLKEVKALKPALVVQGHYHARQTVDVEGLRVEVVGAPLRFTFGEREDGQRGYLLAEV